MSPATYSGEALPADSTFCDCSNCASVRDGLISMRAELPQSLKHDDGSPVMVKVAEQEISALEAWLRLALMNLTPDQASQANKIRAAIASIRNPDAPIYRHHFDRAAKVLRSVQ